MYNELIITKGEFRVRTQYFQKRIIYTKFIVFLPQIFVVCDQL
jgi:hypothetical protein